MAIRVQRDYCAHTVPGAVAGAECTMCGRNATHRIEETPPAHGVAPLAMYLCCGCFADIFGNKVHDSYPYDRGMTADTPNFSDAET